MWGWGYLYFQFQLLLHSYLYYLGSQANIGAKLLSMGDWEKANRMSCWQAIVRTVYPNQRGVITVTGMSSHCWKILISTEFCRRPPEPEAWSYALLGDEAGLAKATVFSIFSTLPWSYSCSVWVWNCSFKQMKTILDETEPYWEDHEIFFSTCYPFGNILSGLGRRTEGHSSQGPN